MKIVVTDPGHGGIDSGATGNGYKEKDLVLALALEIDKDLKRHGITNYLTRDKDKYVSLKDRTDFSNKIKPDIFVSLHLNSATNINAKGLEIFSYTGSINGENLANKIQDELIKAGLYTLNRGTKKANFHVLRETKATAALVESVFISNTEDIKFFVDNFNKYVEVISKAIGEYLGLKYISNKEKIKPLEDKKYTLVKDKVNIILLTEHIAVDGFLKEGRNYIKVDNSYYAINNIFKAMGLEVGWDNGFVTADINKEFKPSKESIDVLLLGNKISIDGFKYKDRNYLNIDGAYISIKNIFESLGFKVEWNRNNNMVLVSRVD